MNSNLYIIDIKKFFNGFSDFTYAVSPIRRIGTLSAHGFIHEVTYIREGYKAFAVLKSHQNDKSSNLEYEYRVGLYINTFIKKFPCFVETYSINNVDIGFYHKLALGSSVEAIEAERLNHTLEEINALCDIPFDNSSEILIRPYNPDELQDPHYNDEDTRYPFWEIACHNYWQQYNILIQHFNNLESFKSIYVEDRHELVGTLFQLYMPLAMLGTTFNHNDLHSDNAQLYQPVPGKCIQYIYNINGKEITFKSKYIVKILDYGNAFFNDGIENTEQIFNKLCKSCLDCGTNKGFNRIQTASLRIYSDTKDKIIFNQVYPILDSKYQEVFNKQCNATKPRPYNLNINDIFLALIQCIELGKLRNEHSIGSLECLGTLRIFDDGRDMIYESMRV